MTTSDDPLPLPLPFPLPGTTAPPRLGTESPGGVYRLLVESVRDYAIFILDAEGYVRSWNPGAERFKGYRAHEIIGQHFSIFYPEPTRSSGHPANELAIAAREGRYEEEGWRVRKDGTRFWANVVITALRDSSGTLIGYAKVTRDLTERREAQERAIEDARRIATEEAARAAAEERAAQLEMLLQQVREQAAELERQRAAAQALAAELSATTYSIAHDLRAPLRAMDSFSRLLQLDHADRLDREGQGYLDRIRVNAQNMARLIDGILGLARLGRGAVQHEAVDLSALATGVVDELRRGDSGRDVDVRIQPALHTRGDPRLLGAVLENLLGNAWKFTRRVPHAEVEFGAECVHGETRYFVRDNGVGFDMEFAGQLFGIFQRLHSEQEFEGSGIGLATVKRIVERHGGTVGAMGAPGQGATFYFTLGPRGERSAPGEPASPGPGAER